MLCRFEDLKGGAVAIAINRMIDDKRHAQIKGALALRGATLSSIARDLNVAPTTVSIVSRGHRRSRRIEKAIAHVLNCAASDLWPERYQNKNMEEDDMG